MQPLDIKTLAVFAVAIPAWIEMTVPHTVCYGFLFDECVIPSMMQREIILLGIWQWNVNSVMSMLTTFSAMVSEKGQCCPRLLYLPYKNNPSAKGEDMVGSKVVESDKDKCKGHAFSFKYGLCYSIPTGSKYQENTKQDSWSLFYNTQK